MGKALTEWLASRDALFRLIYHVAVVVTAVLLVSLLLIDLLAFVIGCLVAVGAMAAILALHFHEDHD